MGFVRRGELLSFTFVCCVFLFVFLKVGCGKEQEEEKDYLGDQ